MYVEMIELLLLFLTVLFALPAALNEVQSRLKKSNFYRTRDRSSFILN